MLFCTKEFLYFFTLIFTLYWLMPWHRARVWLLVGASFYFYACWNKWLALIICLSTLMDYLVARGLDSSTRQWWRRLLLGMSLVANLGLLISFKYSNFFLDSLRQGIQALGYRVAVPPIGAAVAGLAATLSGGGLDPANPGLVIPTFEGLLNAVLAWIDLALRNTGAAVNVPLITEIILPVGISFYTFEAINYTIDVYRRKVKSETNLAHFLLFITFFPHLVAGPIVRARDFLPQIRRRKHWSWPRLQLGAEYFLMGMVKKAIADRMAMLADPVFREPGNYGTLAVWMGVLAYAIQIYFDFSGYTDMALGCAHTLGYKLALNFNMPYLARNVSEFWHRWHISLSTWLRDYLFIPLGGSRGTSWQINRNLMITMTLGGLWHGANWTFVVWGVLHGLYLIVHRAFKAFCKPRPRLDRFLQSVPGTGLCMALTFLSVCVAWVFFRAQTFAAAATVLHRMFTPQPGWELPPFASILWATIALLVVCHLLGHKGVWKWLAPRLPAPVVGMGYSLMVAAALVLALGESKAFIYFQF